MLTSYNPGKLFSYLLNCQSNFDDCRRIANNLLQGSRPVNLLEVKSLLGNLDLNNQISNLDNLKKFTDNFKDWLNRGSNKIHGLDNFESDFSAGTTQSFDSFYFRHSEKKFRCLVGEYFYHVKTWSSKPARWSFVSDLDPLKEGDAFVLSLPFCDTGNLLDYQILLEQCDKLNIPVLIDCCYYTISGNIDIDVNYDCVDTVSFSLSKAFPVSHLRIGVRYTKPSIYDGQKLHHGINYNNVLSAYVGWNIINNYSADYVFNKFKDRQLEVCDFFKLEPSQSVNFALGDATWHQYSRKNLLTAYKLDFDPNLFKNRISLNVMYENWSTFQLFKNEYRNIF